MREQLKDHLAYAKALRREFHQHPEASFQEYWTTERIEQELNELGIATRQITDTGILGSLYGTGPGKCIALRADIDALELRTALTTKYASQRDGFMHACGHDGHIAGLLYAAKLLSARKHDFPGEIRFIFQPAEENGRGALAMIEAGALDGVDAIFGIHVWNDLETGSINVEAGPRMASASIFKLTITGKGGHGAMPHQTVDAVMVGATLVQQLQTIVSRELDPLEPAVVTVGSFHAGSRYNIIAQEAVLEGTTRSFSSEAMVIIKQALERIAEHTAKAFRASIDVEYVQSVIPTVNDPELAALVQQSARKLFGDDVLVPMERVTGGEDFSYYGERIPATFAFVGTKNLAKLDNYPHHHPKFDIDEDALEYSAGLYAQTALDFLNK